MHEAAAAWLYTHLWTHYQYTLDQEFVKKAFPVMAEAALFFVDFLTEEGGYLATNPSVSPENSYRLPDGGSASACIGASMDNQILRELFGDVLAAWEAGSVRGLRLFGNAFLDMTWENCSLKEAMLHADSDYQTVIYYNEKKLPVTVKAGESRRVWISL